MTQKIIPTQREIKLKDNEFIVTKTNKLGIITYANPTFINFSGYAEAELIGQQHNVVRHPDMPRSVFHLLWSTIKSGEEFMGYVKNLSKDGSFYWVFATVTPSYEENDGNTSDIIGFFSVRRKPDQRRLTIIQDLYRDMLSAENRLDQREQIDAGTAVLDKAIQSSGKSYHEFILTL